MTTKKAKAEAEPRQATLAECNAQLFRSMSAPSLGDFSIQNGELRMGSISLGDGQLTDEPSPDMAAKPPKGKGIDSTEEQG